MKILGFAFILLGPISWAAEPVHSVTPAQTGPKRSVSQASPIKLRAELDRVLSEVSDAAQFNVKNCASYVRDTYQVVVGLTPQSFDFDHAKSNWGAIYDQLWAVRVKLRERFQEFFKERGAQDADVRKCSEALRDGFRLTRYLEDYLAESFSGEPQDFKAGQPKNVADPKFKATPFRGPSPWTVINPRFKRITLRSGDVIISRGNAYTSSAIARIGNIDSQFSHLAFIFVAGDGDGKEYTIEEAIENPKVLVLEAHIEVGSTIRKLKEYLDDGNSRNVLYRFTGDAGQAHRAAQWTYNYIQDWRERAYRANPSYPREDVNYNVPYNFQMGLDSTNSPQELFCSQVAHAGFQTEGIQIPLFLSTMNTRLSLPKRMGITTQKFFAPGDMEVEPRFDMIAEYRNLRKLQGVRMKDMVLSGMYRMMEEGYELTPVPQVALKGAFAWFMRQMDAKFVKPQLPKNMNWKIINSTFALERAAIFIEKELDKKEASHKKNHRGLPLGFTEGLAHIEQVKARDREVYLSGRPPGFHWDFRPPKLEPRQRIPSNDTTAEKKTKPSD